MTPLDKFAALIVLHCLADYPLQGEFLARGKNHRNPIEGFHWQILLLAHAAIHAGGVWLVTGSLLLGMSEFIAHMAIDYCRCEGSISFSTDQLLHVACKALWIALLVLPK